MQFQNFKPSVGIVYDSDLGDRIDGVLAMALLYGLDGKNECRVVSVSVSKTNLKSAALAEAIGRFYAGPVSGAFVSFARTLPVGMADDGKSRADTPILTGPLDRKNPDNTPVYPHGMHSVTDTAEPPALIRNAFTAQQDQNAIMLLEGPATSLVKVLDLPGAKELIARKCRYLVVSAGAFGDGPPDPRITQDVSAGRRLFAEWPTPIYACGREIGDAVLFPGESIEKDFAWSPAHPVADAYKSYKPMPYDAPTADLAAALYAVRPKEGYFKVSDPGVITISDDGRTRFKATAGGKHQHLVFDEGQRERLPKTFIEIASAKPVPKQPRFRRNQVDDKKVEPPKPGEPPAPKPPAP